MAVRTLKEKVYWVGALDWDRELFDELIPLPDGTSYNAYLIKGREKTALIDTVDPSKQHELISHLTSLKTHRLDYIVVNHAEQDHSGSLPLLLRMYPDARILTNEKCRDMLITHLHVAEEKCTVVKDGSTIDLGGKTLEFILTPWVHWPETMSTYLQEDKILFPCDFFGSHLAQSDVFMTDRARTYEAAKRYYAEIMMPFRPSVRRNMQKLEKLDIDMIAPSHGVVYEDPKFILDAYNEWISDTVENKALILFVSMHGSTRAMVDHLADALIKQDVTVHVFNLTNADTGEIAKELVDAATVIVATLQVMVGPHPTAVSATYLLNALRPKLKHLAIIGSYGWGGKMVEYLKSLITNIKPEILEPIMVKGLPNEEHLGEFDKLADEIVKKHKALVS